MSIISLSPQGNDFSFVATYGEEAEFSWIGIEEMPAERIDFDFEDRLLAEIDAERDYAPGPPDYELFEEDFDDEWGDEEDYDTTPSEEILEQLAAEEAEEFLQFELETADNFLPAFSGNHQQFERTNFWVDIGPGWKRRNGRKLSKRRMQGNRKSRKDKRQHRQSIKHLKVQLP